MAKAKDKNKSKNTKTPAPTPQPTFNASDPTNSSNEDYVTMVYNFIVGFIQNFIHLLIVIIMGIIILWGCKVSQASLLPTDIFCYPYEEKEYKGTKFMPTNDSDNFDININLKKIEDILMSEKIRFPYKDFEPNQQNMLVNFLTSIKPTIIGKKPSSLKLQTFQIGLPCFSFVVFFVKSQPILENHK